MVSMVLLSCSGTGGIYAKLASGMARYNCALASTPPRWRGGLLYLIPGIEEPTGLIRRARTCIPMRTVATALAAIFAAYAEWECKNQVSAAKEASQSACDVSCGGCS